MNLSAIWNGHQPVIQASTQIDRFQTSKESSIPFSESPSSLYNLSSDILKKITEFLSVKDRFSFKETSKKGLNIGCYIEISLLKQIFFEDVAYLNQLLKQTDPLESTHENLQIATQHATTLAVDTISIPPRLDETTESAAINRISPATYRTYAAAIQTLKERDRNILSFCQHFLPPFASIVTNTDMDEKSKADYLRDQIQRNLESLVLNPLFLPYIDRNTPPEVVSFRMSHELLEKIFHQICDVQNKQAIFRLIESRRLEALLDRNPHFFESTLADLKKALKIASVANRIESVEAILHLTDKRICGGVLGNIVDSASTAKSERAVLILERHATNTQMGCCNRIAYSSSKHPFLSALIVIFSMFISPITILFYKRIYGK